MKHCRSDLTLYVMIFVSSFSFFLWSCSPGGTQDGASQQNQEESSSPESKTPDKNKESETSSDTDTKNSENGKNRLADATSPYLRIHADNPVNWYPWGNEAFKKAKEEDKPIFLSIGYYTCHWCHVMERKVFMNEEIANQLNDVFVNIKVDREQRPAVDHTYMTAAHRMGRRGGWPLSVFMTPDKKPFFIGTYIPPKRMKSMIEQMDKLWKNQREKLTKNADKISKAMKQTASGGSGKGPGKEELHSAYEGLTSQFDKKHAGFGQGNKFPSPHNLLFLLRYWDRTNRKQALTMTTRTLDAMRRGGMYDQIGFGFHRYSTDPEWVLPHFEKMLYDQAMLTYAYAEAYQATENKLYARTARETIQYVTRDMGAENGGFYSALASGAAGVEGAEYVWSTDEVRNLLSGNQADLVMDVYNMTDAGNYRKESSGERTGKNVLHRKKSLSALAKERGISVKTLRDRLEKARKKMYAYRENEKPQMGVDDKILTDWNGMMIAALARTGRILGEEKYVTKARETANFLLSNLKKNNGQLLHRYKNGSAGISGKATDYAYLTWGLIELYQTTFETKWLKQAISLTETFTEHYWDRENGGFYFSGNFEDTPMGRQKQVRDGARPSANSVAMWNLFRLGRITAKNTFEEKARQIGKAFSRRVNQRPSSMSMMMTAVDHMVGPSFEVVIAGEPDGEDTRKMLRNLWSMYKPRKVVVQRPTGEAPEITTLAEYTKNQKTRDGKATAYVCQNYSCKLPTTSVSKMKKLLTETQTIGTDEK